MPRLLDSLIAYYVAKRATKRAYGMTYRRYNDGEQMQRVREITSPGQPARLNRRLKEGMSMRELPCLRIARADCEHYINLWASRRDNPTNAKGLSSSVSPL